MRIIAGEARGRKIKPVPGEGTRPTSDRVKEAMFSILQFHLEGRRVLDLYAGTGQLGAEALSRGARECVFVEQSNTASGIIRENTEVFGEKAVVRTAEVLRFIENCNERFDIVLLDPPYGGTLYQKTLKLLFEKELVNDGGFVMCECASDADVPEAGDAFSQAKQYRYGRKKLLLYSLTAS